MSKCLTDRIIKDTTHRFILLHQTQTFHYYAFQKQRSVGTNMATLFSFCPLNPALPANDLFYSLYCIFLYFMKLWVFIYWVVPITPSLAFLLKGSICCSPLIVFKDWKENPTEPFQPPFLLNPPLLPLPTLQKRSNDHFIIECFHTSRIQIPAKNGDTIVRSNKKYLFKKKH